MTLFSGEDCCVSFSPHSVAAGSSFCSALSLSTFSMEFLTNETLSTVVSNGCLLLSMSDGSLSGSNRDGSILVSVSRGSLFVSDCDGSRLVSVGDGSLVVPVCDGSTVVSDVDGLCSVCDGG